MGITDLGIRRESTAWRMPKSSAQRARAAVIGFLEGCGAFEWVALTYLGFSGFLAMLFWRNLPRVGRLLSIHFAFVAGVVGLLVATRRAALANAAGTKWPRVLQAMRDWYPQAVFLFCFEELASLAHLVRKSWCDAWLLRFDHWLLGEHPAILFARIARPALTDFMQMAYLSYFFYLTILAIALYGSGANSSVNGQPKRFAFWTVMTSSIVAYSIGYVVSIFFPIESPYYSLAALHLPTLHGGPFTWLSDLIEYFGRVHGGAFPSEHVAGSFVALLGAWRFRRRMFWCFLPFFICMCASTVYLRNHYVADVFGGLVTGAVGYWIGQRLMRLRGACPADSEVRGREIKIRRDGGEIPDAPVQINGQSPEDFLRPTACQ
jgi:membrane-associated phospholipid phosphatase